MVGIFILIVCGFGLIAYLSSFMFIKAFSPYLEDVTKQYTDDDPDSWMRPIGTLNQSEDTEHETNSDQADPRKVTKKLEADSSGK